MGVFACVCVLVFLFALVRVLLGECVWVCVSLCLCFGRCALGAFVSLCVCACALVTAVCARVGACVCG